MLLLAVAVLAAVWLAVTLYGFEALPVMSDCKLHEDAHDFPPEKFVYSALMKLRFPEADRKSPVGLVTITPDVEPLRVTTNTCEGRKFLTDLVHELNGPNGPEVIAIDKFFSAESCNDKDVNQRFREALGESKARIVVGQATHPRQPQVPGQSDCLVETPLFDFEMGMKNPEHPVLAGLTRLNQDTRKIPLRWAVFADTDSAKQQGAAAPAVKDGFALVAAKAWHNNLDTDPKLQEMLRSYQQPYGRLPGEAPKTVSAMQILCMHPAAWTEKWGTCGDLAARSDLDHKIIVVGEHTDSDLQQSSIGDVYGVDLQATYIDDLLAGRYLRTFNYWLDFAAVCCFLLLYAFLDLKFVAGGGEEKEYKALLIDFGMLLVFALGWMILLRAGYVAPFSVLMSGVLLILLCGRWAFWLLSNANRVRKSGDR